MNFLAVLVASIVPMILGSIWYNPKVFGSIWMKEIGVDPDKVKDQSPNMLKLFLTAFVFAFMIAIMLNPMVIHQMSMGSLLEGMPEAKGAKIELLVNGKSIAYEHLFRTFKHGALHGFLCALFFALPVLGTHALFENRSFKFIAIHASYWMVSMMLMGGIICAWQ
jgi:hypothetical protein